MSVDALYACSECWNVRAGKVGRSPNQEDRTPDGCPACGKEPEHWYWVDA